MAISPDGGTVVGSFRMTAGATGTGNAFTWTSGGGMASIGDIGDPPGSAPGPANDSVAYSVSSAGTYVVGQGTIPVTFSTFTFYRERPFVYDGSMSMFGSTTGFENGTAWGISADGSLVVGEYNNVAFYHDGTAMNFFVPTGSDIPSRARAADSDGSTIVGQAYDASVGRSRAFSYDMSSGSLQLLGAFGTGGTSEAFAVNSDGSVVVGSSANADNTGILAFKSTGAGPIVSLGDVTAPAAEIPGDGEGSRAYGVSSDGKVIVGHGHLGAPDTSSGTPVLVETDRKASIYFADDAAPQMQLLSAVLEGYGVDLSYWMLETPTGGSTQYRALREATGVAVNGNTVSIVGWGINAAGNEEGFLVTLDGVLVIPEPRTWTILISMGLLGTAVFRRHRFRRN